MAPVEMIGADKNVTILRRKNLAFTLIELLVVITIIALLMSILMPSLQKAREQSRQVVCATNNHSIGQGIVLYAHDNDDLLMPGNYSISWIVWASMPQAYQQVNLGYLMTADVLPSPESEKSVFFCPSMKPAATRQASGEVYFGYETFKECWGQGGDPAPVDYMYNTALDGFGNSVVSGTWAVLSHQNRVQYLLSDGSVHTFNAVPLVFDNSIGPETLQDVCQRSGVNFPSLLLHRWLAAGEVNIDEAKAYLAHPAGWMNTYADSVTEETAKRTRLAQVANTSLVSDVVGAWDAGRSCGGGTPPVPG
jgi:prepilin-type N-terminal cleavage/methylation domain-containing protein